MFREILGRGYSGRVDRDKLIYDWNTEGQNPSQPTRKIQLNDESLRDGLQSPSAKTPTIDEMIEHLHNCAAVKIDALNIGLPGAGPAVEEQVARLARETMFRTTDQERREYISRHLKKER